ncbi:MAG: hypothetical protein JXA16_11385, partial [Bacteroidales bacterium]|nr:hypothetical protein [Bacteroidales bacterium]
VSEEMKLKQTHTPAKENCFKCHNPHSAKKSYLLPGTVPNLCYSCHKDFNTKKNIHKPAGDGQCIKCHATHGSKNKSLLTQKSTEKLCKEYHDLKINEGDNVHNPVQSGRCHKCHDSHQSDFDSYLKNKMPELCFGCHDNVGTAIISKYVHAPAKENCFKCHDAHSAKESFLVPKTNPSLCYDCHDDLINRINSYQFGHKALNDKKSCTTCHSPHGSSEANFLKLKEKDLCLNCHNKTYKSKTGNVINIKKQLETSVYIHGPVNEGCSMCHNPHAANNQYLLIDNFPVGSYAPVTKENFALCFNCHTSELIEQKNSKTATNFRDGDQNLHFLHTNGNRGRNCITCHDMHSSKNEHLIEDKANYGNWEMPIKFINQENGGSCFPGCHSEKKYDRTIQ